MSNCLWPAQRRLQGSRPHATFDRAAADTRWRRHQSNVIDRSLTVRHLAGYFVNAGVGQLRDTSLSSRRSDNVTRDNGTCHRQYYADDAHLSVVCGRRLTMSPSANPVFKCTNLIPQMLVIIVLSLKFLTHSRVLERFLLFCLMMKHNHQTRVLISQLGFKKKFKIHYYSPITNFPA